jgi:hypothetical protein
MPMMGKLTAANKKLHRRGTPPIVTVKGCSPQQGMRRPSAADKDEPAGAAADFQGIIEKAEPVSTR